MKPAPIDATIRVSVEGRAEFERHWRQCCPCPRLEIVEVNGGMRCAACGCPILKRRRTAA